MKMKMMMKKKKKEKKKKEHGKIAFLILGFCVRCNAVANKCVTRRLVLTIRNTETISRDFFGYWAIILGRSLSPSYAGVRHETM